MVIWHDMVVNLQPSPYISGWTVAASNKQTKFTKSYSHSHKTAAPPQNHLPCTSSPKGQDYPVSPEINLISFMKQ